MNHKLGSYQISETIHQGSNNLIFRARNLLDQTNVILKTVRLTKKNEKIRDRLNNEYKILSSLKHESIIKAYSLEEIDDYLVLAMEDIGGSSIKTDDKILDLSIKDFLDIAIQIVNALSSIHSEKILYQDLNPSNIIWNKETRIAKLIDFGLASIGYNVLPSDERMSDLSLNYISPEQTGRMNVTLDYRTDFYSLGATFYEMLTGRTPFQFEETSEIIHAHLAGKVIPPDQINKDLPKVVSEIIIKLMSKDPGERYQEMNSLLIDISKCRDQFKEKGSIDSFEIGIYDITARLKKGHVLYGRKKEEQQLQLAYRRVRSGTAELVLVTGQAGVGKTALIQNARHAIEERNGWFISGKFDQYSRMIPFSAIISAFDSLVSRLLSQTQKEIEMLKDEITETLGTNCSVIVSLIPALEVILGKQPSAQELGPTETLNRLVLTFRNFLNILCTRKRPLVLFLDDLQWADMGSLVLFKQIMRNIPFFLLIGAYRDDEVDENHPLTIAVNQMQDDAVNIKEIDIQPLEEKVIYDLISDLFLSGKSVAGSELEGLAEMLIIKTGGNPLFLYQLLSELHEKNLIRYDSKVEKWTWDIEEVRSSNITDNIVRFMVDKIGRLPHRIQQFLKVAAIAGNKFKRETLDFSIICENENQIEEILEESLQSGLIIPVGNEYQFIHDRVHQAAYSMLDADERAEIHWRIGKKLMGRTDMEKSIFELVDHLNEGKEYKEAGQIREEIIELNLKAGTKAKSNGAFQSAHSYFLAGIELLNTKSWEDNYLLALELHVEASETSYLTGDDEAMNRFVKSIEQHAESVYDKVRVYEIKMQACAARSLFVEGIELGVKMLSLLGVEIPEFPDNDDVKEWLDRTEKELSKTSREELLQLERMTDDKKIAAHSILVRLFTLGFFTRVNLMPIVACEGVLLAVRNGNSDYSSEIFMFYAGNLCSPGIAEYEAGAIYGELGLELFEKYPLAPMEPVVTYIYNSHIRPWYRPVRESFSPLKEAYRNGLVVGEFEYAIYAITNRLRFMEITGMELPQVFSEIEEYIPAVDEVKNEWVMYYTTVIQQAVANLMSEDSNNPYELDGIYYNRQKVLKYYNDCGNLFGLFVHHAQELMLNYLFGRYEEALTHVTYGKPMFHTYLCQPMHGCYFVYYSALTLIASLSNLEHESESIKEIERLIEWMRKCAESGNSDYSHKYEIILGEFARVKGNFKEAIRHYDKAIREAGDRNYIQDQALAFELEGKLFLEYEMQGAAELYIQRSRNLYLQWGARAKARHLESTYSHLFDMNIDTSAPDKHARASISKTMDAESIIKASHAISGKIELHSLLEKLIQTMVENAGAEKGVFIEKNSDKLLVQAQAISGKVGNVLKTIPLEESIEIPISLIRYVEGTGKSIIFDDLMKDQSYSSDPYVIENKPKSVMCIPIYSKNSIIAIVYLENNHAAGIFTPERLDILNLLGSQAVISIENATLFEQLSKEKQFTDTALDAQQDTLFVFDITTGKAVRWNKAFREISEYSDQEIAEMPAPQSYYSEAELENANKHLEKVVSQGHASIKLSLISKSGKNIPFEYYASIIKSEDGNPRYIISIGRNISERIKIEEHLRQNQKMEVLGTFAGGIAHDLNNFLFVILSSIELALDKNPDSQVKEYLDMAIKGCMKSRDLIKQILLFSRKSSAEKSVLDISELMKDFLPMINSFIPSKVKLETHLDPVSGSVIGNPTHLQQVFLNLVSNASQSMNDSGTIRLSLTKYVLEDDNIITELEKGEYFVIAVSDNGCGISKDVLPRIFDPFFTTKETGKGTGLGLAVVYGIIREHEGTITVESEKDKGTVFNVYLPCVSEKPGDEEIKKESLVPGKEKLVLVDDDVNLLLIGKRLLESLGYSVSTASSGKEALEIIKDKKSDIDLLITDFKMPEMNGAELAKKVREIRGDLPIIFCTGYTPSEYGDLLEAFSNAHVLKKPISKFEFSKAIRSMLNTNGSACN